MPPLLVLIACHHSCLGPLLSPPSRRIIFTTTCYRGFHLFFSFFFYKLHPQRSWTGAISIPAYLATCTLAAPHPPPPTSTPHRSIFPEVVRPSIPARPIPAKCPTPTPGRPRAAKLLLARTKTTASKSPRKSRAMHRSPTIWRQYI